MGCNTITVHGFRPSFRDWAGETTSFPRAVIDAALAHGIKDKAEAAYARSDLFGQTPPVDGRVPLATPATLDANVIAFSRPCLILFTLQNLVEARMTAGQAAKQPGIARSTACRLIKETTET